MVFIGACLLVGCSQDVPMQPKYFELLTNFCDKSDGLAHAWAKYGPADKTTLYAKCKNGVELSYSFAGT